MRFPNLRNLAVAGLIMAAIAGPVSAYGFFFDLDFKFDTKVERELKHFQECQEWLITNPAKWKRNCQPSRSPSVIEEPDHSGDSPVAPPAPPPSDPCSGMSAISFLLVADGGSSSSSSSSSSEPTDPCAPSYGYV